MVRQGKGHKDRLVPINEDVADVINQYLADTGRYLTDEGPLFLATDRAAMGRASRRLSTRSMATLVKEGARAAGIKTTRISPHSLRHSYAIRCLRAGANVVAVSKLLGHASLAATQRYVDHLATAELRQQVPSLPWEPKEKPAAG
jgi:integrase/recombinase XerD